MTQDELVEKEVQKFNDLMKDGVTIEIFAKNSRKSDDILSISLETRANGAKVPDRTTSYILMEVLSQVENIETEDLIEAVADLKAKASDKKYHVLKEILHDLLAEAKERGILDEDTEVEAEIIPIEKGKKKSPAPSKEPELPELPDSLKTLLESLSNGKVRG